MSTAYTIEHRRWCCQRHYTYERLAREVVMVSEGQVSFLVAYNAVRGEKKVIKPELDSLLSLAKTSLAQ